jgi:hypothetical protein
MSTLLESINRNDFQEVKRIILSGKHPTPCLTGKNDSSYHGVRMHLRREGQN